MLSKCRSMARLASSSQSVQSRNTYQLNLPEGMVATLDAMKPICDLSFGPSLSDCGLLRKQGTFNSVAVGVEFCHRGGCILRDRALTYWPRPLTPPRADQS